MRWAMACVKNIRNAKREFFYNEPEFDTVLSVKIKLRSEGAILTSKKKRESDLNELRKQSKTKLH